ncbi:MAG TPA: hypothetical protein VF120_05560 [Ktedonobacterales bacterium]
MQPEDQQQPMRTEVESGPRQAADGSSPAEEDLGPRVAALAERIVEMERALGVREWWLLGRTLPEAQALSEIVSLLAVARGELVQVLADVFARPLPPIENDFVTSEQGESRLDNPEWVQARLGEARHLLDHTATVLPALLQYAQVLRSHAERLSLPSNTRDAFGIVTDRLVEACELLQHPPESFR